MTKRSPEDKITHKRRYDASDRKREFQPHWPTQFSWVERNSSSSIGRRQGAGAAPGAAAAASD